ADGETDVDAPARFRVRFEGALVTPFDAVEVARANAGGDRGGVERSVAADVEDVVFGQRLDLLLLFFTRTLAGHRAADLPIPLFAADIPARRAARAAIPRWSPRRHLPAGATHVVDRLVEVGALIGIVHLAVAAAFTPFAGGDLDEGGLGDRLVDGG